MGACEFFIKAKGKSAKEAFRNAVCEARHWHGHGGYTGTIAEKESFVTIPLPEGANPDEYADKLLGDDDDRISDKWGPAGCLRVNDEEFLFFGWASS